jgi:hypothetical protein
MLVMFKITRLGAEVVLYDSRTDVLPTHHEPLATF